MPLNALEQGRHRRQDAGSADQDGRKTTATKNR
jgi:hypothetical protein